MDASTKQSVDFVLGYVAKLEGKPGPFASAAKSLAEALLAMDVDTTKRRRLAELELTRQYAAALASNPGHFGGMHDLKTVLPNAVTMARQTLEMFKDLWE